MQCCRRTLHALLVRVSPRLLFNLLPIYSAWKAASLPVCLFYPLPLVSIESGSDHSRCRSACMCMLNALLVVLGTCAWVGCIPSAIYTHSHCTRHICIAF